MERSWDRGAQVLGKEEIWDTPDKAGRFRMKGEVDEEAVLERKCAADRVDTGVEVDRTAEDREEGKGKVHRAAVADIRSALNIWAEVVEEVMDRVAAMGSWNISEAWVVSGAGDTSDSIFSVVDIPRALRRTWSKGVEDSPRSSDVDDAPRRTGREVSVVVLSVESVSYSRGLTWRSSPTVASSSVICSLKQSRSERTSLALATNASSTLSTNRRCSWTPSAERARR